MPEHTLPLALRFMLAARRAELDELQGLVSTCGLVTCISQLVHDLQKERGYSNLYLGHQEDQRQGTPCQEILDSFSATAKESEQQLRQRLESMESNQDARRARLLHHIAQALQALDSLPRLRRQIREQALPTSAATEAFTRLIASLLAVVFEATDAALAPAITQALIAMCNFMQGKELTGQERAVGVAGFSAGFFDVEQQMQMQQLRDQQEHCLGIFTENASAPARQQWQETRASDTALQLAQLRLIGQNTSSKARVEHRLSEPWFHTCTQYINAMKAVENLLADDLIQCCKQEMARARADLGNHRHLAGQLARSSSHPSPVLPGLPDGIPPGGIGPQVSRALLDRVHEQAERLQQLDDELGQAKAVLEERRQADRAKHLLMKQYGLSEQAAHDALLRASMQSGTSLTQIVRKIAP